MNFEERNRELGNREMDDVELDAALQNFRASVHGWSDEEFGKARVIRRSRWDVLARAMVRPVMGWALASAMVAGAVGVSVTVHHERQVATDRQLAAEKQQRMEQEKAALLASASARHATDAAMDDDELLSHVDSDIAQAAPDAMQPLASLMSDSSTK